MNESQESQEILKERIRRLYAFSELDTPQSWKTYYLAQETYLIIRSLFPGRFSLLRFWAHRVKSRKDYLWDQIIIFIHRLGWCTDRDEEGRCLMCDPYYECGCEDCERESKYKELEAMLKEYANDHKTNYKSTSKTSIDSRRINP